MLDLLSEVKLLNYKSADTPIIQNHKLREHTNHIPTSKEKCQRIVGKLIYLSHTRLDIPYVVSIVS